MASPAASVGPEVAALVDGTPVAIAEVDQRCGEKCARLRFELDELRRATLATLVDETLLELAPQPTPTPQPVEEKDVDAALASFAAELTGPPERDRAAVRFYLERERRRARDAELLAAQRGRTPPEVRDDVLVRGGDPEDVVAEIGERKILRRDVEARAALPIYRLEGELSRERRRQLDELLDELLWRDAAAERGLTIESLRGEIRAQAPPVTDADIERHFEREVRARNSKAEFHPERIRPYLEFRRRHAAEESFLLQQRDQRRVTVVLREPEPPRIELPPGPGGFLGAEKPRVRVVFLTSYRGEPSRRAWKIARELVREPDVALGVRPLLPQWDPEGTLAAAAVRCAAAQSRFQEMQDAVASAPSLPTREDVLVRAGELKLDEAAFAACLDDPATQAAIAADSAAAERYGIVEPPVFLVNGRVLGGNVGPERLRALVDEARLSAPSTPASASP
ncbi:MAG TPA: thioredoxin domain-containing protein [Candidatus Binatia bacterium]